VWTRFTEKMHSLTSAADGLKLKCQPLFNASEMSLPPFLSRGS
jgi:hypothetical protein